MPVRLHLIVPALTPRARLGWIGAGDGLDKRGRDAVIRHPRNWPEELRATCAPEPACVETAALLGLDAAVDESARDWDLGAWAGRSFAQVAEESPQALKRWSTDPNFAGHGGESLQDLRSRATKWLDRLEGEGHSRLVAVAPTAVVRAALLDVLDAPSTVFWRLDIEPMSSVHVSLRQGRRAIRWSAT